MTYQASGVEVPWPLWEASSEDWSGSRIVNRRSRVLCLWKESGWFSPLKPGVVDRSTPSLSRSAGVLYVWASLGQ